MGTVPICKRHTVTVIMAMNIFISCYKYIMIILKRFPQLKIYTRDYTPTYTLSKILQSDWLIEVT